MPTNTNTRIWSHLQLSLPSPCHAILTNHTYQEEGPVAVLCGDLHHHTKGTIDTIDLLSASITCAGRGVLVAGALVALLLLLCLLGVRVVFLVVLVVLVVLWLAVLLLALGFRLWFGFGLGLGNQLEVEEDLVLEM